MLSHLHIIGYEEEYNDAGFLPASAPLCAELKNLRAQNVMMPFSQLFDAESAGPSLLSSNTEQVFFVPGIREEMVIGHRYDKLYVHILAKLQNEIP